MTAYFLLRCCPIFPGVFSLLSLEMNIKNWSRLLPALVLEMSLGSDSNRLRRAILLTPFIFTQKEGFSSQDLLLNPCIILNQELLLSPENLDGKGPARAIAPVLQISLNF
jgi:hypothetical protein